MDINPVADEPAETAKPQRPDVAEDLNKAYRAVADFMKELNDEV